LVPFYQLHDARYMLYWPVMSSAELETKISSINAKEQVKLTLKQQTDDYIALGEQQPEADHNFQGNKSNAGEDASVFWRSTADWISYDLKNTSLLAKRLRLTYGTDKRLREFDIFINNQLIKSERMEAGSIKVIHEADYELPNELIGQPLLTIKIVAKNGTNTGAIYSIRLLK